LDAGAMVCKGVVPITDADTTQTLHDVLSKMGAELMVVAMATLETNTTLPATPQDEALVTYAHKLDKAEAAIDWQKSAHEISRQIRAFNPFPVAQSHLRGEVCRIWMATADVAPTNSGHARAGEILSVLVVCGEGVLHITELQAPGGKRLSAPAFVQGHHLQVGEVFTDVVV